MYEPEKVGEKRSRVGVIGVDLVGPIEAGFQYGFQALGIAGRKASLNSSQALTPRLPFPILSAVLCTCLA